MGAILLKASGFLLIIFVGYVFKRVGIFSLSDSRFLTNLIMKITLPAAIFTGFHGLTVSPILLFVTALGVTLNLIMNGVAYFVARKKEPSEKAFYMINTSSYNIGNFTIPFTQAFFPPEALAVVCMFDVGNAFMCFGGTFTMASMVSATQGKFNANKILKTLVSSVPFDMYLFLIVTSILGIQFPEQVYTITEMFGRANSFLAMLLIGILFATKMQQNDAKNIGSILLLRIVFSTIFAMVIYWWFPLPEMVRKVLVIVVYSPILSVAPVFSERCGYSKSVAAVLNSFAIPISMVAMTTLLIVFHI